MMNREIRQKRPTQLQIRERYALQHKRFIESQFTYNSHLLLKKICEAGQKQPNMYRIPLYKICLQVVKLMMMNELQILFFGSTLREMTWKIVDPCLIQYFQQAVDISPDVPKDNQAKKIQLALLLIAYIVKMYLNQDNTLFDFRIRQLIRNHFDKMYQAWVQKVKTHFKFNPKNMNRLFKELDSHNTNVNTSNITDYNKLVADFLSKNEGHQIQTRQKVEEYRNNNYFYSTKPIEQSNMQDLPVEQEEDSQENPHVRMDRRVSDVGFVRRQSSGNEFLPSSARRGFDLARGVSIEPQEDAPFIWRKS